MSEQSTSSTTRLLTEALPAIVTASSEGEEAVIEAYLRYHVDVEALTQADMFDEELARRLSVHNADELGLDTEGADAVLNLRAPILYKVDVTKSVLLDNIWRGTGSSITADRDATIVHYISKPGIVEEKYGPTAPYILRKLGWSLLSHTLEWGSPDTNPAYSNIKGLLVANGLLKPEASLHIGAAFEESPLGRRLHGSASGVLPLALDVPFQSDPAYAVRAEQDRAAGLYDWEHDRRAGLYDLIFAKQVMRALLGDVLGLQNTLRELPDISRYDGIDIN